jgi:hypothetical protein
MPFEAGYFSAGQFGSEKNESVQYRHPIFPPRTLSDIACSVGIRTSIVIDRIRSHGRIEAERPEHAHVSSAPEKDCDEDHTHASRITSWPGGHRKGHPTAASRG